MNLSRESQRGTILADLTTGRATPIRAPYKRPMDLAILIGAHLFPPLVPVWLLAWTVIPLAIWLEDRGPVFYRQRRMGQGGKPFIVLKFRTMVPDADKLGAAWTQEHDPRVTKVGRFLRKTALDELPQILSIWKGDMTFVGPRALAAAEQAQLETDVPGFAERLRVKPGLTGLAQLENRSDAAEKKLEFDRTYIAQMSFWLDAKLIVRSVLYTLLGMWDSRGGKPTS